jgi:tRNA nucleotidyltransferase (CCA-adding enzyme)
MCEASSPLLRQLCATLTSIERSIVGEIVRAASTEGAAAYLVGGGVRDLLLGITSIDLDITVEGDGPSIARAAARRAGLNPPQVYEAFGTATLWLGERGIDVITARREWYRFPGALPMVAPATLADDLARRDFTINAMALALNGGNAGELLDPFGGALDLKRRLLRILHEHSFEDDATRLLRAARYAARFHMRLEPRTAEAAAGGRRFLATISPARIRHEFERIFAEMRPARALAIVQRMGLPEVLVPGLRYTRRVLAAYRRLGALSPGPSPAARERAAVPQPELLDTSGRDTAAEGTQRSPRSRAAGEGPGEGAVARWLLPIIEWDEEAIMAYAHRFDLSHRERVAAMALPATRRTLLRLVRSRAPNSVVVATLERLPIACLTAWVCFSPESEPGHLARDYLERLRHVRPLLTSNDLLALGVPPGPLFGELLRRLRSARLDDPSLTLDVEQALVQHVLDEDRGA